VRRLRVLLDAGVLVDAPVRDVFLALAEADMVEFRWSQGVLDELRTLLVDEMGRPAAGAERLCDALRGAFPLGEVTSSDEALAARLAGDHPDGVGALVAAVTAEADVLVSHERHRFPPDEVLARWDLAVLPPDDALAEMVGELGADRVASTFATLAGPHGLAAGDLLDGLRRLGQVAPVAAVAIGAQLDAAEADELARYLRAARPDDARAAVSELVNRVGDGDLAGMDMLLTPAARMALGPTDRVRHRRLQQALLDVLLDPGEWGYGDAPGTAALPARTEGAEVVALVHRAAPAATAGAAPGAGVPGAGGAGAHPDAQADRLVDALAAGEAVAAGRALGAGPAARPLVALTCAVVATPAGWRVDDVAFPAPAGPG
jgi:hypothetical protein